MNESEIDGEKVFIFRSLGKNVFISHRIDEIPIGLFVVVLNRGPRDVLRVLGFAFAGYM